MITFNLKRLFLGHFCLLLDRDRCRQQPGEGERYEVHDKVLRGLLAFLFINLFVLFQSQLHRNKVKNVHGKFRFAHLTSTSIQNANKLS